MTKARAVLIVDDDADVRRLLERTLTPHGYVITTASNIADAIKLLEAQRFDAVITDKNMPGGSGLELIEGLRVKYPMMAVLLMTAFPESGVYRLGIDGYLPKPFKTLELVRQSLNDAIERRALQRQRQELQSQLDTVKADLTRPPSSSGSGTRTK